MWVVLGTLTGFSEEGWSAGLCGPMITLLAVYKSKSEVVWQQLVEHAVSLNLTLVEPLRERDSSWDVLKLDNNFLYASLFQGVLELFTHEPLSQQFTDLFWRLLEMPVSLDELLLVNHVHEAADFLFHRGRGIETPWEKLAGFERRRQAGIRELRAVRKEKVTDQVLWQRDVPSYGFTWEESESHYILNMDWSPFQTETPRRTGLKGTLFYGSYWDRVASRLQRIARLVYRDEVERTGEAMKRHAQGSLYYLQLRWLVRDLPKEELDDWTDRLFQLGELFHESGEVFAYGLTGHIWMIRPGCVGEESARFAESLQNRLLEVFQGYEAPVNCHFYFASWPKHADTPEKLVSVVENMEAGGRLYYLDGRHLSDS